MPAGHLREAVHLCKVICRVSTSQGLQGHSNPIFHLRDEETEALGGGSLTAGHVVSWGLTLTGAPDFQIRAVPRLVPQL